MRKRGFTLIEVLIAVVIFTIAILMSSGAVVMSSRVNTRVEAMREVQDETRSIAEYISREISGATAVATIPNTCDTSVICDQLTITKLDDENKEITETISPTVDNRGIQIDESGQPAKVITTDKILVRKLSFATVDGLTALGKFAVRVELAMEEASLAGSNYNKSGVKLVNGMLGNPVKMELRFVASNLDDFN